MKTPTLINLPKILDRRGNLSVVEQLKQVPFKIERAFWIYDVPGDSVRGGHAFRETEEFVVALSGSFDVVLHDGEKEQVHHLNRSYYGVYVPKMMWREMRNFSTNAVALVVASTPYAEDDYIMEFDAFVREKKEGAEGVKFSMIDNSAEWHIEHPSVYDCSVINLPKYEFEEGNLTWVQRNKNVPFDIKRAFYLYDIPGGEARGAHAHKLCHQFLIAVSGAFEVVLDDGINKRTVMLNRPFCGLHIPPGIWAAEQGFSSGSVCLVLASEGYEESDYIREYSNFLTIKGVKL
jgi:dTDP-4-dehydrorhamnose 3,5-epimerase-like enzyme